MTFRLADLIDSSLFARARKDMRSDGRAPNQLRPVNITPGFIKHAEGSALIEVGETKVVCTVSVEERVPPFLKGKGEGWITSEYGMLPRATTTRTPRESNRGQQSGRSQEIQRLIGRSLRAVVDLKLLGERTLWVDCDVIQADGGTRTASITGAFVAMVEALRHLRKNGAFVDLPLRDFVAATSVGRVSDAVFLDLAYDEDSRAQVDMNIVKTGRGQFVEIQGTAEGAPFGEEDLRELMAVADQGIRELIEIQKRTLGEVSFAKPRAG